MIYLIVVQKANKNISVVHIAFAFYPYMNLGGVPRAVFDLTRAQSEKYNVTVVTNQIEKGSIANLKGIKVLYLKNISRRLIYDYQFYTPIFQPELIRIIKGADILHFHGFRNLLNELIYAINGFFNRPSLLTTHGTLMNYESKRLAKTIYDKAIGSFFLNSAKYIVAHSEIERYELIKAGISPEKMAVIPNGVYFEDLDRQPSVERFCQKFGIDRRKNIVLFIGKITRRKGLDVSIDAIRRLRGKNVQMMIAGEVLDSKIQKFISGTDIKYIGHLDLQDKIDAICAANLLLYPSIYEAFGYVPFEAFYLKKPCIVGDDFGTSEHLSPVVPEFVMSYGDAIELSEMILRFINDKAHTDLLVNKVRKYIIKNFSIQREVEGYDQLYQCMLQ